MEKYAEGRRKRAPEHLLGGHGDGYGRGNRLIIHQGEKSLGV